jgi:prophage regulatory protein
MSLHDALPATGFVRLTSVLAPKGPIPVSKSTWWAGVKTGRYPAPVKLGPRITAWRVEDIRALVAAAGKDAASIEHTMELG